MDARRSYYLNSRQSDFADVSAGRPRSELDETDIPFVIPANDNVPPKGWLSASCRALFFRLNAMRSTTGIDP